MSRFGILKKTIQPLGNLPIPPYTAADSVEGVQSV
jgi:hypothetical protein